MKSHTAPYRVAMLVVTVAITLWQSYGLQVAAGAAPTTAPAQKAANPELDRKLIDAAGSQSIESVKEVKELLDQGADPTAQDGQALYRAVTRQRVEIAKLLISHGARAKVQCIAGWTALHWAAALGETDVVDLILDTGAPINPIDGPAPLHIAASRGQAQVVILLLGRGADAKATDSTGSTALHAAASQGNVFTVQLLIGGGADANARDSDGRTPLFSAVSAHNKHAVVFLLSNGANIHATDNVGRSLLSCAKDAGTKDIVDMLAERGATE